MFLLNSQSSDVCIPWAFDILLLENSQKIEVLIYRMFDISLKPEHCLLLADHNLLLSSQVFKRENEPAIFYFYLITSINKSDRYSNGKMNLQFFHILPSLKIYKNLYIHEGGVCNASHNKLNWIESSLIPDYTIHILDESRNQFCYYLY